MFCQANHTLPRFVYPSICPKSPDFVDPSYPNRFDSLTPLIRSFFLIYVGPSKFLPYGVAPATLLICTVLPFDSATTSPCPDGALDVDALELSDRCWVKAVLQWLPATKDPFLKKSFYVVEFNPTVLRTSDSDACTHRSRPQTTVRVPARCSRSLPFQPAR
jgi:hypothetical protein